MSELSTCIQQAAAIPIANGKVCLITSSNGRRWIVPKGCLEPGRTIGETALQETWEEAGLVGVLQPEPVGSFYYEKAGNSYHVTVFLMQVTQAADEWPERFMRTRRWVSNRQAIAEVSDPGLRRLLRRVLTPAQAAITA